MKKRKIIITVILVIILLLVIGGGSYYFILEKGKDYAIEEINEYHYFVVKQGETFGVIDEKGNTIVNSNYQKVEIPNPEKPVFICYQGEQTKVFNEKGEEILIKYNKVQPIQLKNISSDLIFEKSVLKYEKDGKYGLLNLEGKEITKAIYEQIDSLPYKEGELLVKQNEKYGVINIKGNVLVESQYDEIQVDEYYTSEKSYRYAGYIVLLKTSEGYRYGYLNYKGKEILKIEYNEIERVKEIKDTDNIYLIGAKNGQYGVTKNEETVIKNEYQSIHYDGTNQVMVLEKSKKYGVANLEGKVIIPIQYDEIDITGNYLYAKNHQGVTVYNKNGTQANVNSNIAILNTSNENYKIRINNENGTKYGVIQKDGKQLIEEKYNYIEYLYDHYFIVSDENGKLGIIDDKGNIRVEMNHDSLQKIQNTDLIQAVLTENKTVEIYAKTMEKICQMENAIVQVEDFYIKVSNELETRYFDLEGKEQKNTEIYKDHTLFVDKKNGKYGFVDKAGNIIVDYQYEKAYELNRYGFAAVKKDGKWGAINEKGQEVVAPIYEFKDSTEPSFIGKYYQVTYAFGEFYYTDKK